MEKRTNIEKHWFMHTDISLIESEVFLSINARKSLWASLGLAIQNYLMMHKFLNSVKFLFSCIFQISA